MKLYEYAADAYCVTRYGVVEASTIREAYSIARDVLKDGEVLRGVNELTPEEAALAAETTVVQVALDRMESKAGTQ